MVVSSRCLFGAPLPSTEKPIESARAVRVRDQLGVSITREVDRRVVMGAVIVIEHVDVTERSDASGEGAGPPWR